MKEFSSERIRNVALAGHQNAGKTMLAESMLLAAGAIERAGKVEDGNTTSDYLPEETKRGHSVAATPLSFMWREGKFNVLDTPGFADFQGEVCAALHVCENVVLVAHAAHEPEIGLQSAAKRAHENKLARFVFINGMDRERADFDQLFNALHDKLHLPVVALNYPLGAASTFNGFVDVLSCEAFADCDGTMRPVPVPPEIAARVTQLRESLIETAVECDDGLMEKYLEGSELDDLEIRDLLHRAVQSGCAVPVMCGSATKNIGVQFLLDRLQDMALSPLEAAPRRALQNDAESEIACEADVPFAGYVYKTLTDPFIGRTTYLKIVRGSLHRDADVVNYRHGGHEKLQHLFTPLGKRHNEVPVLHAGDIVQVVKLKNTRTGDSLGANGAALKFAGAQFPESLYSLAIEPVTHGDDDKLNEALARLGEEDQTLKVVRHPETGQMLISGLGDVHLTTLLARLKNAFGVDVKTSEPRVPYRETIRKPVKFEGKLKKQSGGHGQFADAWLEIEPLPPGSGFEFVDKVVGGVVPRAFIPAVEEGVRDALRQGPLAGFPLVDLRVTLFDGKYHDVDSSYQTFKAAGSLGLRGGAKEASPVLLEPMTEVSVCVPEDAAGDVVGDLNARRGHILGMEPDGDGHVCIKASVPEAELSKYVITLRSLTHGHGTFTKTPSHYSPMPDNAARTVIEAHAKAH